MKHDNDIIIGSDFDPILVAHALSKAMVEEPIPEYMLNKLIRFKQIEASNRGEKFDPKKIEKTRLVYRYSPDELRAIARHLMILAENRK